MTNSYAKFCFKSSMFVLPFYNKRMFVFMCYVLSIFSFSARSMPGMGSGNGRCFLLRGRWTVISCDLELLSFITARCTLVQSAVLPSHVVCLSVCLSVCNVGEL